MHIISIIYCVILLLYRVLLGTEFDPCRVYTITIIRAPPSILNNLIFVLIHTDQVIVIINCIVIIILLRALLQVGQSIYGV